MPDGSPVGAALIGGGENEFDRDTVLRRREPGVYDADLSAGWMAGPAMHGGYLLALAGRALTDTLRDPDPFTITAHYLTASRPGPAVLRTEASRPGRAFSSGHALLTQLDDNGAEVHRVRAIATFGDLGQLTDDVRTTAMPPSLPPPENCVNAVKEAPDGFPLPEMLRRLESLLDPSTLGWAMGAPSGRAEVRAWLGFADGRDFDPLGLLMAADALPPTALEMGLDGWFPTVELTVHVRCRPAPGLLRIGVVTRNLAGGMLEEDAEIWDSQDRLVAQSRQLAQIRTAPAS